MEVTQGSKMITEYFQVFKEIVEDIYSVAWLPENEYQLIYSMEKEIWFFDTRQSYNQKLIYSSDNPLQSKLLLNLKFDPFLPHRFAACSEDQVLIFDLRMSNSCQFCIKNSASDPFDNLDPHLSDIVSQTQQSSKLGLPLKSEGKQRKNLGLLPSQNQAKSFSGFSWSVSRPNLLATFSRQQSVVKFWDLEDEAAFQGEGQ
mmetsp:Transcript_14635/g.24940  ORF Transcript_14635/g.24940 Transcript_14635/m.24940 type:complete len:201 (+) Transcript_14635:185-787(+)